MLQNSFIFLPGVGVHRERLLWRLGIDTWSHLREAAPGTVPGIPQQTHAGHRKTLLLAEAAYAEGDAAFFGPRLGTREAWRALGAFMPDALFLDIETTGLGRGRDHTTLVGLHSPRHGTKVLVHGDDLTAEAVEEAYARARVLVTFNGASFDIPFLRNDLGVAPPPIPHVDLMLALRRVGLAGGLKKVEAQLGLERPAEVRGMDGYAAVLLWQRHLKGDAKALDKLIAYNREDVRNLAPLSRIAYDRLVLATRSPAGATNGRDRPDREGATDK